MERQQCLTSCLVNRFKNEALWSGFQHFDWRLGCHAVSYFWNLPETNLTSLECLVRSLDFLILTLPAAAVQCSALNGQCSNKDRCFLGSFDLQQTPTLTPYRHHSVLDQHVIDVIDSDILCVCDCLRHYSVSPSLPLPPSPPLPSHPLGTLFYRVWIFEKTSLPDRT